ncbi:MAG: alpha/beta hydrolase [Planctomycetota bacterium]
MNKALLRFSGALALLCSGCHLFRSAVAPMPYTLSRAPAGAADTLVVLLPGIDSRPEDFDRRGWTARVHAALPQADVLAADAHLGYFTSGTLVERLHQDVIAPRAGDYERVWLVGISLGGFACALYAGAHPAEVDRVLLLAPYMGRAALAEQVVAAGGLHRWTPPATDDLTPELAAYVDAWRFYQGRCRAPSSSPQLFLGYGDDDPFRVPNGALATALPADRCFHEPGGHTWPVWDALFERMLAAAAQARADS